MKFVLFCDFLKSGDGRTDVRTKCVKIMITFGRDYGSALWINKYSSFSIAQQFHLARIEASNWMMINKIVDVYVVGHRFGRSAIDKFSLVNHFSMHIVQLGVTMWYTHPKHSVQSTSAPAPPFRSAMRHSVTELTFYAFTICSLKNHFPMWQLILKITLHFVAIFHPQDGVTVGFSTRKFTLQSLAVFAIPSAVPVWVSVYKITLILCKMEE